MTDFHPFLCLDSLNRKIQRARRAEKFRRPQSHAEKFKGICREQKNILQREEKREKKKRNERREDLLCHNLTSRNLNLCSARRDILRPSCEPL